jgi:ABC-2 type transport system permease protein
MAEASVLLHDISAANPFSHAVESIRFALHVAPNPVAWAVCLGALAVFMGLALWGYDPAMRLVGRKI